MASTSRRADSLDDVTVEPMPLTCSTLLYTTFVLFLIPIFCHILTFPNFLLLLRSPLYSPVLPPLPPLRWLMGVKPLPESYAVITKGATQILGSSFLAYTVQI